MMKILLFLPGCGRTGSEVALCNLIRSANRSKFQIAVACGARGELSTTFPKNIKVFRYCHALSLTNRAFRGPTLISGIANRILDGIIWSIHERCRPDAWYVNSIVQPNVVALAERLGIPCILHTHELESMLAPLNPADIDCIIGYPKLIIAGSRCAAEVLRLLGRQQNIEVCYGSIDSTRIKSAPDRSLAIRQQLKIPPGAFVWAMSGTRDPNKNAAAFVSIAAELLKLEPNTYFLWVGGTETGYSLYARALAQTLGIADHVLWVAEQGDDYFNYLGAADGIVVTSHRESLSLLTLEAAALGKPFVSFNSGGPKEIFRDGMGIVVDSWNLPDFVDAMLQVMRGAIYLNADISKARAAEFDVSVAVRQWEEIIQRHFGG